MFLLRGRVREAKMKKMLLFALIMTLFVVSASAVAARETLTRMPITSCSGSGELVLYNGNDPFIDAQEDVSFSTNGYDQLLIFTRTKYYKWLKVHLDSVESPIDEFWSDGVILSDVKVHSVDTSSGSNIDFEAKVYNNGTRGIQAFVLQNTENPFFNDGFHVIWDDATTDTTYFYPGAYNYVFFDKYSYNKYEDYLASDPDNRPLTIIVRDIDSNVVYTETFTHPSPSGTQGVAVAEFEIVTEGWYEISVDTEDSVYWGLIPCEPVEIPEFGVIAAGVALIGALVVFAFSRKK